MTKTDIPMQQNSTGVFDNWPGESHTKVVLSLHRKGYTLDRIAKATGLSDTLVRAILVRLGVRRG